MTEDKFIKVLMENKPDQMMNFLLENGKKPKPISPIYFIKPPEEKKVREAKK
jgi:hypothetical protein